MSLGQDESLELLDAELNELQKRFRALEGDRKNYIEESRNVLRKQRIALEKLKKENEYLNGELTRVQSADSETASSHNLSLAMTQVQEQNHALERQMEIERRKIDDLIKMENMIKENIITHKQDTGGVHAARDTNLLILRQVKSIENKLDFALLRFNEALTYNRQLREKIDMLRKERVSFEGIYKKLERQLLEKKKEMTELLEMSNTAYEQRDEAQGRMIQLKEKAEKDIILYEEEIKELNRVIEQDRKMKEFMKQKEPSGRLSVEERKKRRQKDVWEFVNPVALAQLENERTNNIEVGVARVLAATGMGVDEFASKFIKTEQLNFDMFNQVSEITGEIERLEAQIADTRAEIEKFKTQGSGSDNQHKKIIQDLEDRLQRMNSRVENYESKHQEAMGVISTIKAEIENAFNRLECDRIAPRSLVEAGLTEDNIVQYLGIVEQRVNEIIQTHSALQIRPMGSAMIPASNASVSQTPMPLASSRLIAPTPMPGNTTTCNSPAFLNVSANLPTTHSKSDSEEDDDSEDEMPMTVEAIKAKTLQKINKQESIVQKKPKSRKEPGNLNISAKNRTGTY